jgi:hypothetical protein
MIPMHDFIALYGEHFGVNIFFLFSFWYGGEINIIKLVSLDQPDDLPTCLII